ILFAQTPPAQTKDPLGRNTPQEAIIRFLEACHSRDYVKASKYLDLRQIPAAERAKDAPDLAAQLEDLLDDTPFDIATLSRDPEGDQDDGLASPLEQLATFHVDGRALGLQLERVELKPGLHVWLVSAPSVGMITEAHKLVAETPFEKKLPQWLVTFELLDTPVWRWIALVLIAAVLWFAAGMLSWGLVAMVRPLVAAPAFRAPLRLLFVVAGLRGALEFASPSTLPRLFIERGLGLIFVLALAWAASVIVDLAGERWHAHLDPRVQSISYSVLPLGRQILKLSFYLFAVLGILAAWGYNTSTIVAGLGVGGLAVALAAQKTIENLFGGISVIGDRPVLVGDVCRFGDRTGTVMHIGLRSTRIRTPERTIISVPNAQFSTMALENISGRDKIWFHPILNLRRDTTTEQMSQVLAGFQKILDDHPKVEVGKLPVRFIGVGSYSLDVEVNAYVTTHDSEEFLALQQELLLQILKTLEAAGTGLAVPLQESVDSRPHRPEAQNS
ncbi:MAG: mechanosensitive ion channel family protein, partial [Acidobacteriota bacterium]|nr:mechanosensitive ion channel family protein [Acidobacteriota bacterium]